MSLILVLIAFGTLGATLLGGLFALRFSDKMHLALGFSAGAVIGVAFFDLLPEAIRLGAGSSEISTITSTAAFAFVVYLFADRVVLLHAHTDEVGHGKNGALGASTLSLHSFLDGIAIGLSFHISAAIGVVVAAAVLTHDFSDGINTVNLILKNGGTHKQAFSWLFADAVAPVLGIISTLFFTLPQGDLALILASFCGFFLYLGASDLLPESHHGHPTIWTTVSTAIGILVIYFAVSLAGL